MTNDYQAPEIVELGDARELTLGYPNRDVDDACDCTKSCGCGDGEIIAA